MTSYSFRAERFVAVLIAILVVLILVHVIAMQMNFNPALGLKEKYDLHYWQLEFFDLDAEESFGTWFNSGLLFLAAILCLHRAQVVRAGMVAWRGWWLLLGAGLWVLSIDEIAGMHEWVNSSMEDVPWTVIGMPIFALVGLAYLPFLWHFRWRTGSLFLLAGAIYGGGAVGVEHLTDSDVNSLHYNMWTALEEGMEMLGMIIFIYAMMDHLRETPEQLLQVQVGLTSAAE